MPLDKIVVLVMALAFFGGIAFLCWKTKKQERKGGQASASAIPNSIDDGSSNKSQEKERSISKS
jgi:hypothetical protein